jgi:hypothetical protein
MQSSQLLHRHNSRWANAASLRSPRRRPLQVALLSAGMPGVLGCSGIPLQGRLLTSASLRQEALEPLPEHKGKHKHKDPRDHGAVQRCEHTQRHSHIRKTPSRSIPPISQLTTTHSVPPTASPSLTCKASLSKSKASTAVYKQAPSCHLLDMHTCTRQPTTRACARTISRSSSEAVPLSRGVVPCRRR